MNELTDAAVVAAVRRQMTVAVAKQVASSGNLANLDPPGYKAIEVSFSETLEHQLAMPAATHPGHIGIAGEEPAMRVGEVEGVVPRRDGNTVQMDRELLVMGRAAGDFSAAQTALAAKFRLVRYAINDTK
jgi:flagellar basal-body rod protein FlgB